METYYKKFYVLYIKMFTCLLANAFFFTQNLYNSSNTLTTCPITLRGFIYKLHYRTDTNRFRNCILQNHIFWPNASIFFTWNTIDNLCLVYSYCCSKKKKYRDRKHRQINSKCLGWILLYLLVLNGCGFSILISADIGCGYYIFYYIRVMKMSFSQRWWRKLRKLCSY